MDSGHPHPRLPGFSLVELVIVIVIIGIISAIGVPRLSVAIDNASLSTLKADLATIRRAMDQYALEHMDRLPNIKENGDADGDPNHFIERLMGPTDSLGKRGIGTFGPYLRAWPPNRYIENEGDRTKLKIDDKPPPGDGHEGWHFDKTTGRFYANSVGHTNL